MDGPPGVSGRPARCYARDYLRALADGEKRLAPAARAYTDVAAALRPVWRRALDLEAGKAPPDAVVLTSLAERIRCARGAEAEGIDRLREYLERP